MPDSPTPADRDPKIDELLREREPDVRELEKERQRPVPPPGPLPARAPRGLK